MQWSDIDFNPPSRTVRQFAVLWLVFFGGLAFWEAASQKPWATLGLAAIAVLGGVAGLFKPAPVRPLYAGWMVLVFPLGWAISHVLLALLFFGLFTPLALILKLGGRDPLRRRAAQSRNVLGTQESAGRRAPVLAPLLSGATRMDRPRRSEFEIAATQSRGRGLVRDLLGWLGQTKKWWLLPVLIVTLLLGLVMLLSSTAAALFIYTLF